MEVNSNGVGRSGCNDILSRDKVKMHLSLHPKAEIGMNQE